MNNSRLINLLKKFYSKELREFEDFAYSPFFNKNGAVVMLFTYLRKYYPEFEAGK